MDSQTALVLFGSAQLANKLLGPTVDYVGEGIKGWAERRAENVRAIFRHAEMKLGDRLEIEGGVSPRVLKGILDEGSFCDDELMAEYFGGVLASARSPNAEDDTGAVWVSLITQLSSYQLRTHYILYTIARGLLMSPDYLEEIEGVEPDTKRLRVQWGTPESLIFTPDDVFERAVNRTEGQELKTGQLLSKVVNMPNMENLIGTVWYGQKRLMETSSEKWLRDTGKLEYEQARVTLPSGGIAMSPSNLGTQLYMWAHGKGDEVFDYLNPDADFQFVTPIDIVAGAGRLVDFLIEVQ